MPAWREQSTAPVSGRRPKASEERTRGPAASNCVNYGDLVARRQWQTIILRSLVRAGAADDGGPGSAGVAEGMIEE